MIENRFYRNKMNSGRFRSFTIGYKDSDLWIGVDHQSFCTEIIDFANEKLKFYRKQLESLIEKMPLFASSFTPIQVKETAPKIAHKMVDASKIAKTGPMAAVAGTFSEIIGQAISKEFNTSEIVVENGGDIYLELNSPITMSVYAGNSSLSEKVGIEILPQQTPLGVCTSAGTVGPSKSFGRADAVMVVCKNTAVADALATAIGNRVQTASDIEKELNICEEIEEIKSLIIICENKIGIKGAYDLKLIR